VPGFSGPLDLLLSLIEEGKMDIGTISLATVTDQYLARVRALGTVPPEHLAEFLLVAATLLLLKSRKLFPEFLLSEEEEERIASLEEQLLEYRKFRDAAKRFIQRWNQGILLTPREGFHGLQATFYPPTNVDLPSLVAAMHTVVRNLPRFELLTEEIVRRVVSIEERIRDIERRVTEQSQTTFQTIAAGASSRLELIVSFLALLELVKQRLISVQQRDAFHDILVARRTDSWSADEAST
jgi:segregation and condensation protein A